MLRLLLHWVLSAVSFALLSKFLPGFHVASFGTAMMVAAVYGILHVLLYKILVILAFIPVFLTLGLFTFVIEAFLLFLADKLVEGFQIDSFIITILAAILLTILNTIWWYLLPF